MRPLRIEPTDTDIPNGELGVVVHDGQLSVPVVLASAMREQGVRTATDFLAYATAFPTFVAEKLQWPVAEVVAATERLGVRLGIRQPAAADQFAFGALDPAALRRGGR